MFVKNVNTAAWHDYRQMTVVEGFQGHQLRRRDVWCGAAQAIGRFKGEGGEQRVHAPPPIKFQERLSGASRIQENLLAAINCKYGHADNFNVFGKYQTYQYTFLVSCSIKILLYFNRTAT